MAQLQLDTHRPLEPTFQALRTLVCRTLQRPAPGALKSLTAVMHYVAYWLVISPVLVCSRWHGPQRSFIDRNRTLSTAPRVDYHASDPGPPLEPRNVHGPIAMMRPTSTRMRACGQAIS